jgi:hypothetical protein
MATLKPIHTFHIPVMGLAYTIDSPIRVAKYGISSVISIMDDELIEKMNAFYSEKFDLPYQEITQKIHDYRAERICSYLNLVDKIVKNKFENFKTELSESKQALQNYVAMLPNKSNIKVGLQNLLADGFTLKDTIKEYLEQHLYAGDIDVNIMTKLDKDNFNNDEQLPISFNDAHAALRGFANSTLESSVVLSAGMNPRLYGYFENFSAFFPDINISNLCEDNDNNLWLISESKLYKVRDEKILNSINLKSSISSIICNKDNNLWMFNLLRSRRGRNIN